MTKGNESLLNPPVAFFILQKNIITIIVLINENTAHITSMAIAKGGKVEFELEILVSL